MTILNLADKPASQVDYEISHFPDGQQQVKLNMPGGTIPIDVLIKARLNNFSDLEVIICSVASLRELGVEYIHLYTPYILGCRSDIKFEEGSNNYLKTVICPIINSLKFSSVTVTDPHSTVLEALINNFKLITNRALVRFALNKVYKPNTPDEFILISPDAGANKKIYKLAEEIGYKGDIITCTKLRDKSGKLTHTEVPISLGDVTKDLIIIDDICDGGATFINIAKAIQKKKIMNYSVGNGKVYLIVTHGIFSKGLQELETYFDGIFCTNSYRTLTPMHWVVQLNIF